MKINLDVKQFLLIRPALRAIIDIIVEFSPTKGFNEALQYYSKMFQNVPKLLPAMRKYRTVSAG